MSKSYLFFNRLSERLGGSPDNFPLTVRVFHLVLVISIVALVYNTPLNLLVGLPHIALASGIILLVVGVLYFLSRFRNQTTFARVTFCLIGTCFFFANFFWNSGIDGPTGYFFILMLVIIVAVAPVSEYWYWVSTNVGLFVGLHWIQYFHADWIPDNYLHKSARYIDMTSAYFTVSIVILACFYIIRKRYAAERQEAELNAARLQVLDAERNKLFSIISHDMRSPLSMIQGYLELLTEVEISEAERKEIKIKLLQATRGTLEMTNNILQWSANKMNGADLQREKMLLSDVLPPLTQLYTSIAAQKNISLECDYSANTSICCNRDMLQLIIRNLLNNAIKFTSEGGWIRLCASCDHTICKLSIIDSGNGSAVKLTDDIFKLNYGTTRGTANEKGVGLGLALCREYIELMGGQIRFECGPESGTTFHIEIPVN